MNTSVIKPVSQIQKTSLIIKKHIIDSINLADYDVVSKFDNVNYTGDMVADINTIITLCEREFVNNTCRVEEFRTAPANVVKDWIAGLPTCLDVAFSDYDIIKIGLACGSIKSKYATLSGERTAEQKFVKSWFDRVAIQLLKLAKMKKGTKSYNGLITYCQENNK